MKTSIFITLILSFLTVNVFGQAEEIVTLKTDTGDLEGTLCIPETDKLIPVVLIIAGSGPTDRDGNQQTMQNNSLKMLASELSNKGIASLRYDKRGVGKSANAGLAESDLRFEHYIEDAEGWIDFLERDGRFGDIVIIGHSQGSLIGMIASQYQNVEKFISIAGVGQTGDQTIREQLSAQPPIVLEQASPILDQLVQGETVEDVPPMLNALFRPSVQPYIISWFKYDPQEEIAKLKIPVLIIQGDTDIQVSTQDAERLANANPNAKLSIIEGMNHVLKDTEPDRQKNILTYNQPELPIKPELIEIISDFIND